MDHSGDLYRYIKILYIINQVFIIIHMDQCLAIMHLVSLDMEFKMILITGCELILGHNSGVKKDYSKLKWEIVELIMMLIYEFLIIKKLKFSKLNILFTNIYLFFDLILILKIIY